MFELDWGKLVIIGIVALIVIGPKELPSVLRTLGQWMAKVRRMASEFQGQFQEAMREAEMADLKKQVEESANSIKSTFDPLKSDIDALITEQPAAAAPQTTSTSAVDPPPAAGAPADPVALEAAPVAPPAPATEVPVPERAAPVDEADFAPAAAPATPKEGGRAA